jgi:hypothetical protein
MSLVNVPAHSVPHTVSVDNYEVQQVQQVTQALIKSQLRTTSPSPLRHVMCLMDGLTDCETHLSLKLSLMKHCQCPFHLRNQDSDVDMEHGTKRLSWSMAPQGDGEDGELGILSLVHQKVILQDNEHGSTLCVWAQQYITPNPLLSTKHRIFQAQYTCIILHSVIDIFSSHNLTISLSSDQYTSSTTIIQ